MKRFYYLLFLTTMLSMIAHGQQSIGIGTTTPNASAILDISSNDKGMLVPRLTTAQRTGISNPANGLLVYDTETLSFWYYNGSGWANLVGGSQSTTTGITFPFDTTVTSLMAPFAIQNTGGPTSVAIKAQNPSGYGFWGRTDGGYGVRGDASTSGIGVYGGSQYGAGVKGSSYASHGVLGISSGTSTAGVRGEGVGNANGVFGYSDAAGTNGVYGNNPSGTGVYGFSNTGTGIKAFSGTGLALDVIGKLKIAGSTTPSHGAVLTSDVNGIATWKNNRIAFCLRGVNSNYTGMSEGFYTRVHWTNETYDYGNDYNLHVGTNPGSNSSTFVVPTTGIYHFDTQLYMTAPDIEEAHLAIRYSRNGVTNTLGFNSGHIFGNDGVCRISLDVRLLQGDIIWVDARQFNPGGDGGNMHTTAYTNFFNCHLIFAE